MKHRTEDLSGETLDAAVMLALGMSYSLICKPDWFPATASFDNLFGDPFQPSARWDHGGPIIERERITIVATTGFDCNDPLEWCAEVGAFSHYIDRPLPFSDGRGETPLVAAMRAFVAAKLGGEVEFPDDGEWP